MEISAKRKLFFDWVKKHFRGPPETIASVVVVIVIGGLGLAGVFGSSYLEAHILSALCVITSLIAIFLYQLWLNYRETATINELNSHNLGILVQERSPLTIHPKKIRDELSGMLDSAKTWSFRGGSGRWQREAVLPHLGRERNRDIAYRMLILDPTEERLCGQYADYRNKHRRDQKQNSASSVRNDLLACIVACAWYERNTRIQPVIYLSQTYSPLRQDMSDGKVAVTVADQTKEGLFIPASSWYYDSLVDEFEQHCLRSPQLTFKAGSRYTDDWRRLTSLDVQLALESTSLKKDGVVETLNRLFELSDDDLSEICSLVFEGRRK
ncbi:hypothetical protein [Arthrobacter sp. zg-Y179]|uniref:hypothetical protein n=1 Tax=Arthrobacter sp. zg-Y179 TaxID=2894188 RepID=UPI001E5DD1F5|nr:hypothetical protein [Arthrobacter sp. zg-Y179]MCC9173876.1 hypothetical protein [Arthrobacter sp. zg-Y179]